ncbi:cyclin-domain-containing protein [Syncephalastrum racemosum]|uniref:Cyclin-domain-containing protein n=1 Tax=Syncephalastrum racemosum TaxID=13706 RepID=A0A1X2H452_SYNRA|nr:cyclin-domain-containing protein [Syncephalastrum racemosum]
MTIPQVTIPICGPPTIAQQPPIGFAEHLNKYPSSDLLFLSLLRQKTSSTTATTNTNTTTTHLPPAMITPSTPPLDEKQSRQDQQRAYVNALVDVTVQAIASIWPNAISTPNTSTTARPVANLSTFLHHILKHSRTTHSTLQLAIFYLFRIRPRVLERRHDDVYISCGRRMFLAALICAHKFLQDKTYKNSAWSKVSGLSVHEVNHAEKVMLQLLDWALYVKKDTYDQWIAMLQQHLQNHLQLRVYAPILPTSPTTATTVPSSPITPMATPPAGMPSPVSVSSPQSAAADDSCTNFHARHPIMSTASTAMATARPNALPVSAATSSMTHPHYRSTITPFGMPTPPVDDAKQSMSSQPMRYGLLSPPLRKRKSGAAHVDDLGLPTKKPCNLI